MKHNILSLGIDPILHFEAVARAKSLKKASQELNLSAPAVTQSINKLEANLGVKLCIRSRGGFELTEAGKKLHSIAEEIKNKLLSYEHYLNEETEFDGIFSIGMIDNFQNHKLEIALEKTMKAFPKMKLSLQVHSATELQNLIVTGEIDIGFGIFNRKLDALTYRIIGAETICHYISEFHPFWGKRESKQSDYQTNTKTWVDIIHRERNILAHEIFDERNKQKSKISSYTNNLNAAVILLGSGTTIVPLPSEYLESRKLGFKFRALRVAFPPYTLKQELVMRRDFLQGSIVGKFFQRFF